jgi:hypothetical protein
MRKETKGKKKRRARKRTNQKINIIIKSSNRSRGSE